MKARLSWSFIDLYIFLLKYGRQDSIFLYLLLICGSCSVTKQTTNKQKPERRIKNMSEGKRTKCDISWKSLESMQDAMVGSCHLTMHPIYLSHEGNEGIF